jgi:hypothetical protein
MDRFNKIDIQLQTTGDCWQALLNDYCLRNIVDKTYYKLVDGYLCYYNNSVERFVRVKHGEYPSFHLAGSYAAHSNIENRWYNNIPKNGILCKTYCSVVNITSYIDYVADHRFSDRSGIRYDSVQPLTLEEVKEYIYASKLD